MVPMTITIGSNQIQLSPLYKIYTSYPGHELLLHHSMELLLGNGLSGPYELDGKVMFMRSILDGEGLS